MYPGKVKFLPNDCYRDSQITVLSVSVTETSHESVSLHPSENHILQGFSLVDQPLHILLKSLPNDVSNYPFSLPVLSETARPQSVNLIPGVLCDIFPFFIQISQHVSIHNIEFMAGPVSLREIFSSCNAC